MENEENTKDITESEDLVSVNDSAGIKISEDVVAVIAGVAASEVQGVCRNVWWAWNYWSIWKEKYG